MQNKAVVTRFAPSPTGVLHTGSARTALYNFLFAKKMSGKFLLRIEDTDLARSKDEHVDAIIANLKWLGLNWDGDIVFQMQRHLRHQEVARSLLANNKAYLCFATTDEIERFRASNPNAKYTSPWRNASDDDVNKAKELGFGSAVSLKVENFGATTINDLILGDITVENKELDDMVILRSDGTPTYMLAVVVDDHDMAISHVIRGDDHLTNAFRQKQIYDAMKWDVPYFAHIPLICNFEGKKLSKRDGALGVDQYQQLGYLPEAVNNHLLRLGFGYKDEEIIDRQRALEIFSLDGIGRSSAKFDLAKLNFINGHYMGNKSKDELFHDLLPFLPDDSTDLQLKMVYNGLDILSLRANNFIEMKNEAMIFYDKMDVLDQKSQDVLNSTDGALINEIIASLELLKENILAHSIKEFYTAWAKEKNLKLSLVMQVLRALIIGTFASAGVFEIMEIIGVDNCIKRARK